MSSSLELLISFSIALSKVPYDIIVVSMHFQDMSTFKAQSKFINFILPSILVLVTAIVLSGCSLLSSFGQNQAITLKFWGLWESSTTINEVINEYKKIKPNINIVYEKRSKEQYRETLQSFISQNKGPDIFVFHNTWTPMLKNELAPAPQTVISSKEFLDKFYQINYFDLKNDKNNIIGLPQGIDGLGLYVNEDIFKSAGVDINFPVTWQNVARNASKLTVKDASGNIKTAGVALGTASNVDHFSDILALMILQNGGDPKSPLDKQSADALDYYTSFAKDENKVWDSNLPSSTQAFASGSLAMYIAPSWRAIEIKNANPLLKFKVLPVPQLEGGKVAWATYWANGVSVKSQHTKEAWEFVKYLSEEQTLTKLYSEASKSPGRFFGEAFPRISMASKLTADPIVGAYVSGAPYMRSAPMASFTHDNGLNDQIIKAYETAINTALKGGNSQTTLATAEKEITKTLTQFGAK